MEVRSVLFAAGRGERLRPLTDRVAKPALPVGDRPLGAYGLALLAGFGPTVVNLSHLAAETRAALEPWAPPETRFFVESPEPFGTAGTLAALLDSLAPTFVTLNADSLLDLSVTELLVTHRASGVGATLAVATVKRLADLLAAPGGVDAGGALRAERFIDRRSAPESGGLRFVGMAVLERSAVAPLLEPGKVAGLGTAVFRPLVEAGRVVLHRHDGLALDVGTPEDLARARKISRAGGL